VVSFKIHIILMASQVQCFPPLQVLCCTNATALSQKSALRTDCFVASFDNNLAKVHNGGSSGEDRRYARAGAICVQDGGLLVVRVSEEAHLIPDDDVSPESSVPTDQKDSFRLLL
jgi:hypothetical protein